MTHLSSFKTEFGVWEVKVDIKGKVYKYECDAFVKDGFERRLEHSKWRALAWLKSRASSVHTVNGP